MAAQFTYGTSIGKHYIERNDEKKLLLVDSFVICFTPKEYLLMLLLLQESPTADAALIQEAFPGQTVKDTHIALKKHIGNICSKLMPHRIKACRINQYGYILIALDG
ncbi:MAG TPA: hypothetical protein VNG51_03905 [Ktedonobacteraceae bacterium]|nr:hypothetical protein [Ktedonobacteraceae bacterium]